jgi:hypothetical protein
MNLIAVLIISSSAFSIGGACSIAYPLKELIRIGGETSEFLKFVYTLLALIVAAAMGHTAVVLFAFLLKGKNQGDPDFWPMVAIFVVFLALGAALAFSYSFLTRVKRKPHENGT